MTRTVFANGRNFSHKGSGDKSISSAPDVCKTPRGRGTPPIPYPVTSTAGDLDGATTSVLIDGNPTAIASSIHTKCTGDEPGSSKGVTSGSVSDKTQFTTFSFDVMCEGEGVVRHMDMTTMNKANTIGMMQGTSSPIPAIVVEPVKPVPQAEDSQVTLDSDFALDQLQIFAKKDSLAMFMHAFIDIFGSDIPAKAYAELYQDAKVKAAILRPTLKVKKGIASGSGKTGSAAFFNNGQVQEIWVGEQVVRDALKDNDVRGELMSMLVEEYGHYLDYLLRNHYAATERDDALNDEGAGFAYSLFNLNPIEQSSQTFARATVDGVQATLVWNFSEFHNNLKKHVNLARQQQTDNYGNLEFFKAGNIKISDKYAHGNIIEKALAGLLRDPIPGEKEREKTIHAIYFGNWMRDMSQVIDPMAVRPMANASNAAAQASQNYAQNKEMGVFDAVSSVDTSGIMSKNLNEKSVAKLSVPDLTDFEVTGPKWQYKGGFDFEASLFELNLSFKTLEFHPVMLSVQSLTSIVELMAAKEFIRKKEMDKEEVENYEGHLKKLRKEYIALTPQTLGGYRPEEHIDNPLGLGQDDDGANRGDKTVYSGFVGYVPNDHALHQINKTFGMKNYIRSTEVFQVEGVVYPTAYEYIISQLKKAGREGGLEEADCLINFGAAMHTLEDYFAHTNFTEISLIKSIESLVYPWVDEVKLTGFKYSYEQLLAGKGFDKKYLIIDDINKLTPEYNAIHKLAAYIPIVTGTFGLVDTMASVLPVLNQALFSLEIKEWKKFKPGERTFNDVLILELLKDFDSAQAEDGSGTNDDSYVENYQTLLTFRDSMGEVKDFILLDSIEKAIYDGLQYIGRMLKFVNYHLIKVVAANINDAQTLLNKDLEMMEAGSFSIGINPSHTQIGKDDLSSAVHSLSAELAIEAVKQVGEKMMLVWDGNGKIDDVIKVLDKIMRHPVVSTWQEEIVKMWAHTHGKKLCDACSPSAVIDGTLRGLDEIDEALVTVDNYIKETSIAEQLDMFFEKDEAKKQEEALSKSANQMIRTARQQNDRALALKKVWDKKYPKPAYCRTKSSARPVEYKYLIQPGDTLWGIAIKGNTTVNALQRLNNMSTDRIYEGDYLKVPFPVDN